MVAKLIEALKAGVTYHGQLKDNLTRLRRFRCTWSVIVKKNPTDTAEEATTRFKDLLALVRKTIGPNLISGVRGDSELRKFPYTGRSTDELIKKAELIAARRTTVPRKSDNSGERFLI